MSPGGRNLVHADGTPALLVADTAWALLWRATVEQCQLYAADRQRKGFNAVLLMSVQPDMHARGPHTRTADEGFDVGFEDLPSGHINHLNPCAGSLAHPASIPPWITNVASTGMAHHRSKRPIISVIVPPRQLKTAHAHDHMG